MKILYLSRWFPFPADNGSRLRISALLEALARAHRVDLVSFTQEGAPSPDLVKAHSICHSVVTVPYSGFDPTSARSIAAFVSPLPRSVVSTHSTAFAHAVERAVATEAYDLIIASQIDMAPYALACRGVPLLLDELQVAVELERKSTAPDFASRVRAGLTWWKLERYLRSILPRFGAVSVASNIERTKIKAHIPEVAGRLELIPNGVSMPDETAVSPRCDDRIVYAGSVTFAPNLDAVNWFAAEMLPLVVARHPAVRLEVTGRSDGIVLSPATAGMPVELIGYVEDVRSRIQSSRAAIVPLRVGGGTRLKILEALALGTPVISTSKGAEGLDLMPGRDLLIADTPAAFADAVLCVLKDDVLHAALAQAGRNAAAHYDWRLIGPKFIALAEAVAAGRGQL